jgi:Leucine-rich repeat (LRR) protein
MTRPSILAAGAVLLNLIVSGALVGRGTDYPVPPGLRNLIERRGGELVPPPESSPESEKARNYPEPGYTARFINCDDLVAEDILLLAGNTGITSLDLRLSRVTPDILLAAAQLPGLTDLDLSSTRVADADLPLLTAIGKLARLRLNYTAVSGPGIRCLLESWPAERGKNLFLELAGTSVGPCDLDGLRSPPLSGLDLSDTPASDDWLERLPKGLDRLVLARTNVTDAGLAKLAKAQLGLPTPTLTWLDVSGDRISDSGVGEIAKMTSLRTLLLGKPRPTVPPSQGITDESLDGFKELRSLAQLDLSGAALSDVKLQEFVKDHSGLTDLKLEGTPLTGSFDWKAPNLRRLDLSESLVNKEGLEKIGQIGQLKELWLRSTDLNNKSFVDGLKSADAKFAPKINVEGTKVSSAALLRLHVARVANNRPPPSSRIVPFTTKSLQIR